MGILSDLNALGSSAPASKPATLRVVPRNVRSADSNLLADGWGQKAPTDSDELRRVLAIPQRTVDDLDREAMIELVGRRLRLPPRACVCQSRYQRNCILTLKSAQAQSLYEMGIAGGLLGPIVVGGGKTALNILAAAVIPGVKTAVLLVPSKLVEQLKAEYMLWSEHWKVPSMVAPKGWAVIQPGRPAVHVIPTSQLSQAKATTLLEALAPDLIVIDEAHHFRYPDTARTSRLLRYFVAHQETKLCAWSGSLTDKSVKDYGHLSALALRERSPLPLSPDVLREWAAAIDPPPPGKAPAPIGALKALCNVGESLQHGYRRRLLATRGVVATDHGGIDASLYMHERDPGPLPQEVEDALVNVRSSWQRPDGEELVDNFALSKCARELAAGFFYRWKFPRGEPRELIDRWLKIRRNWHAEVRSKLQRREEHLDQPLLLARAAIRYYADYDGDLPTWKSEHWREWRDIRDRVKPETEAIWVSDYLVNDAAAWGVEKRGIVWYEHTAFGQRVAEVSGLPLHRGGPDAEARIKAERGDRSIIASIKSHGEGRDGLQFLFARQLVANPPVSKATGGAGRWEQLFGRLHREGQEAPEINTDVYRHTDEMREAFDRALELAQYVTGTIGSFQKLLATTFSWVQT